jgi:hypothetical protein
MKIIPALLVQSDNTAATVGAAIGGMMVLGICLVIAAIMIAGLWKVFVKAGQPGWACLVPIYNVYTLVLIAGKPGWWTLLYFVPFVNIVVGVLVAISVAKSFGRSAAFGVFLLFFLGIGYLIIGFGGDRYLGPEGAAPGVMAARA